jgi:signal transduction histidine kinase/ActR/RegA family two-component response regulator
LRRRLLAISVGVFIGVQGLIVLLAFAGIGVSEVARSYATGEALYSKAQKEAVIDLLRYSRTHSEADFAAYEGSIAVLNGDHTARVALERANPDLATARAGFLTGHNSTADVSRLIQGYLLFQDWPPFAKAVDDWRAADVRADALQALAFELHRSAAGPGSDADFARIETLDAQLSGLERQFSAQMGATARLATSLAYAAIALISLAACIAGLAVGWRVQRALTRAGEELALARDRAEEASRAKSEFLANMSHEIRTPLTGVIGFGELLMKEPLEPPAADYAARIVTSGQALLGVVNDILDFSKIEAGQVELDPQPLDPARFLAETADLVGPEAERKGLALVVEPGWLPAALAVDAGRVRQVLLNLLTNAVKFTRQGEVRIAARYDEDAALLRIEVSDTGIGIPEDRRNRLFQRFSQADGSTSREFGGSGLGLAICRRLTELMGGDIGVTSRAGVGSTFWVTVAAPVAALAPDADAKAEAAFEALPARILVVDDLAANREITRALLGPFGHDIVEAAGGQEAVDLAACSPYDLILMDMQMPGMDGLAATRLIRRDQGPNRWTPIVALSANVMADHLAACRDAGMDDHVGKPILVADLIAKVAQWAGRTHEAIDPTTLSAAAS